MLKKKLIMYNWQPINVHSKTINFLSYFKNKAYFCGNLLTHEIRKWMTDYKPRKSSWQPTRLIVVTYVQKMFQVLLENIILIVVIHQIKYNFFNNS